MNIALDRQSTTKAILNISIEKDDYQTTVNKKLLEYGKQIQLKGFRPGKVPKAVVQKMYGKSILLEEVNKLISNAIGVYVKENKLNVVGEPRPIAEVEERNDWTNPALLEFAYELGIASDFEVDFKALQLTKYIIQIGEDLIDETILKYRKRLGKEEEVESIEEDEDYITIKIHLENEEESSQDSITDKAEEEKPSVEEVTEADEVPSVSLVDEFEEEEKDSEISNEYLANFMLDGVQDEWKASIKGLKKGETISLPLKEVFGEDVQEKLVATLTPQEWEMALNGEVKVTIKQIERTIPAEMDEEFFNQLMSPDEEKTEESLSEKVREQIQEIYEKEAQKNLLIQAKKALIEQANITLPDEFLREWLTKINEGKFTPEEVEQQYTDYAEYLKWDLIVGKISRAKIDEEEYSERPWVSIDEIKKEAVKDIFAEYGMPYHISADKELTKELEQLAQNYLNTDNGETYQKIYNQVSANKACEVAVVEAQKEEKEITIDEYNEMIKNN